MLLLVLLQGHKHKEKQMSYKATGQGEVILKENLTSQQISDAVANACNKCPDFRYDIQGDTIYLSHHDNYEEHDVHACLQALVPLIKAGNIDYKGEDGAIWRFRYNPTSEKWIEENGVIDYNFSSFSDDELISELTKRGYTVSKAS